MKNFLKGVLLNIGSSTAVQSELVANPTRLTETFETRAASKNATQCTPTMQPMSNRLMS